MIEIIFVVFLLAVIFIYIKLFYVAINYYITTVLYAIKQNKYIKIISTAAGGLPFIYSKITLHFLDKMNDKIESLTALFFILLKNIFK